MDTQINLYIFAGLNLLVFISLGNSELAYLLIFCWLVGIYDVNIELGPYP